MLSYNIDKFIDRSVSGINWLEGDKLTYRTLTPNGTEFYCVDAVKGTRSLAFNHEKLAAALSKETGKSYTATTLPFQSFNFDKDLKTIHFRVSGHFYSADLQTYTITKTEGTGNNNEGANSFAGRRRAGNEVASPDGTKAAFIRNYNLWVKDIKTGTETQLTTDGIKDFGYATDNAGWKHSDAAILKWSPDSKKIATFQQDQRNVGDMYLVSTNVGHPKLYSWKYPLPGDKEIAMIHRVIIDVEQKKVIRLNIPPDPHRATLGDDISSSGTFDDIDWSEDGTQLAFVSTSRDHKNEKLRIANAQTGEVKEVLEETVATQFESGQGRINWRFLPKTNEIIWYSESDNWGHLYLYNATSGKLKNQITKGNFVVTQLLKIDEKNRILYFYANGLQTENPYFTQLYSIGFDGKNMKLLTPGDGIHSIQFSPSGNFILDTWSKPDVPQTVAIRNLQGKLMVELERRDISRLKATGWKPPTPFSVKAHDGVTDIYGILFLPSNFNPNKKYPIIDYIYPGPQGGSISGAWAFGAAIRDNQALAELGFIVMALEGTGNPLRSKSFHDMYYPNMSENTLPDQVTAIRQLAQRFNYIDTNKIGIWGHSGGGFATACAMFKYPDFFKVGISESGNHDNRNYEDDWGERYIGLLQGDNYEMQANQIYAKNLKGKLMLAHGLLDDNVPPYNTLLVVEALEKANKDYDLVIFPNSAHGYGAYSNYMMRRRWDYFVRNLLGEEPPKEYKITPSSDPRNVMMMGMGQ
ncbi:MAG: DPP IV N-terminal domain-containing protein [Bacteroidetes bacterium]|nr:DPP IV N-terminal domain-containing protein [Bacteroidota bacterium]MBS1648519.1 DPP IV N-terminal domain-containing protein [Bacteroidota bacterium]